MVQSEQNWLSLLLDLCYMKMVYYKLFCKLCKNLPTSNRLSKYCKNVIVIKCKFFRISWRGQILFFDQVCSHSCSTDCITNKVNIFNWIFYGIRYSIQYIPCTLALDSVNGFFFGISTHNTTFPLYNICYDRLHFLYRSTILLLQFLLNTLLAKIYVSVGWSSKIKIDSTVKHYSRP